MNSIPQTSGIYMITCTANGKIYIGSSVNMRKRWNTHRNDLRKGRHVNPHLMNAWLKYGEFAFVFSVIIECDKDSLLKQEQFFLETLYPYGKRGFNIAYDSSAPSRGRSIGKGKVISNDTRLKLKNANLGKTHSRETRAKMSISQRGKKMKPESIAKTVAAKERRWLVVSPDGEDLQIINLSRFCRNHNLNHSLMIAVAKGQRTHHHGWKCKYA